MILSIIIPVYNMKKQIVRCLDSILNQKISLSYEIIIVDDGSTDGTDKIISDYSKSHSNSNIRFFQLNHGGVSKARNFGMSHANGNNIMFVDADDYLNEKSLETIVPYLGQADYICIDSNVKETYNGDLLFVDHKLKELLISTICRVDLKSSFGYMQFTPGPVSKVYSKNIIKNNNIEFNEDLRMGEDMIFNIQYISCISSVLLLSASLYHYSASTSSRKFSNNNLQNEIDFNGIMKSELNSYNQIIYNKVTLTGALFVIEKYYKMNPDLSLNQKLKEIKCFVKREPYRASIKQYRKYSSTLGKKKNLILFLLKSKLYYLAYLLF